MDRPGGRSLGCRRPARPPVLNPRAAPDSAVAKHAPSQAVSSDRCNGVVKFGTCCRRVGLWLSSPRVGVPGRPGVGVPGRDLSFQGWESHRVCWRFVSGGGCSTWRVGVKGLASLGPFGTSLRGALDTAPPGAGGQVGRRTEPPAVTDDRRFPRAGVRAGVHGTSSAAPGTGLCPGCRAGRRPGGGRGRRRRIWPRWVGCSGEMGVRRARRGARTVSPPG
jgi:hypothetical protein